MNMFPNIIDMYHGDNRENLPDFKAIADIGIWGIIHKASQGTSYTDPKFSDRIAAAGAAGLLVGAYHFLDASDPIAQADHFLSITDTASGSHGGLLLAVDFEKSAQSETPALHQLQTFMSEIDKQTRISCVLYSGDLIRATMQPLPGGHMHGDMIGAVDFFRVHRLWLAEYGPHENIPFPWNSGGEAETIAPPWLWQYKSSGHMPSVIGDTDLNYYAGSREQLTSEWIYGPRDIAKKNLENQLSARGQMS